MLRIVVCVSGGGTNLQAIIDGINDNTIEDTKLVRVISNNPNAYALERANINGVEGICISARNYGNRDDFNQALINAVEGANPDLIVLAGFLVVLPESMIQKYKNKIINIHPSLIPSFCGTGYYGLKVHEGVLNRGVKITGATVHFVDEGTDTGPIIIQKAVDVLEDDTPESLQKRVMEQAEWVIMPQAINMIAKGMIEVSDGVCRRRKE